MASRDHPLGPVLAGAAAGRFPPADGEAILLPPDPWGSCAVVAFTGRAYVLADRSRVELDAAAGGGIDGYGAAGLPEVLRAIAGPGGGVGTVDVVLVARGTGTPVAGELAERHDLADHPRVRRALRYRRDVRVLGDERGFVTIGSGLVGRTELSVELTGAPEGRGAGRVLIAAGLAAIPAGQCVFAQVAPGNAASLRAFLAAGFVPIGSEVLIMPRR